MKLVEFLDSIIERKFEPSETLKVLTLNQPIYFSWGVSKKVNYDNGALMLQVNGHHHKGKVFITLAWDDTYTVYITTNRYNVKKKFEGIYFDMLVDTIDREIERIDSYK